MDILQIVWFSLIGVLLAAFCVTGGFDFGAGITFGFLKERRQREFTINTIAPFWDGNQVWLITAGGALFAAFPKAYADVLSMMYTPVILLLLLLIIRVVAIEFYGTEDGERWRSFWRKTLFVSSFLSVLLFGVALGAIFSGVLLEYSGSFVSDFLRLFTPLTIAAGLLTVMFFSAHGGIFMAIKANGSQDEFTFAKIARTALIALMAVYIIYMFVFVYCVKAMYFPTTWIFAGLIVCYIPLSIGSRMVRRARFGSAFICTAVFAALIVAVHCLAAFPYIIPPTGSTQGLLISDAASSPLTLKIMLGVALTGVPLAIAYNIYSHLVFAKKKR